MMQTKDAALSLEHVVLFIYLDEQMYIFYLTYIFKHSLSLYKMTTHYMSLQKVNKNKHPCFNIHKVSAI